MLNSIFLKFILLARLQTVFIQNVFHTVIHGDCVYDGTTYINGASFLDSEGCNTWSVFNSDFSESKELISNILQLL